MPIERRHAVAGVSGDPLVPDTVSPAEEAVEDRLKRAQTELAEMKRSVQRLIDRNRFDFELFAESAAPRFVFSDGFYMLFEKKEVHMDTKWFSDRKFSPEQLIWATYHELAHFYDFMEDPKSVLGKFEDMERTARETGAILSEKFRSAIPAGQEARFESFFEQKPIDPEKPERGTMNSFEAKAYKTHHEFWNIVDDIYVNSLVAKRKPAYGEGGALSDDVKRLYREQLFQEGDFSNLPRHKQYVYALIRQAMLPGENTVVSDEVRETLERKLRIGGKEKTAAEIVKEYIQSHGSVGRKAGVRYLTLEVTLEPVFQELLLKDIEAWKPQIPPEPDESQEGESGDQGEDDGEKKTDGEKNESGNDGGNSDENDGKEPGEEKGDRGNANNGGGENAGGKTEDGDGREQSEGGEGKSTQENLDDAFNPSKSGSGKEGTGTPGASGGEDGPSLPRPITSPEDLKNILDILNEGKKEWQEAKRKEGEKNAEQPKSEEDIKNELDALRKKQFADTWAGEFDMTPEEFSSAEREYEETERAIRPYLVALDTLWQRIIYGRSRENARESASRFKTGVDIDIDEVVRQFPEIISGETDKARVMTRTETVREFVERPELIRVRFVGDASGSMDFGGGERREILRAAFVLLFTSLRRFETYLNLSRGKTKSKLSVDTEAWIFGSDARRVKPFRGGASRYEREKASVVAAFAGLGKDHGSTRDDRALAAIDESLSPEEVRKIKSKKVMELVFELTDGGTDSGGVGSAKESLAALDEKGVVVRAFQIGTTNADEQATFESVWNTDRSDAALPEAQRRGHIVGADLENLIPALTAALARFLGKIEL